MGSVRDREQPVTGVEWHVMITLVEEWSGGQCVLLGTRKGLKTAWAIVSLMTRFFLMIASQRAAGGLAVVWERGAGHAGTWSQTRHSA